MKLLLIEDNIEFSRWLNRVLSQEQFNVDCAYSNDEALRKINSIKYELIILDLELNTSWGGDLLKSIRNDGIDTPIIVLTGYASKKAMIESLNEGADDFMEKPCDTQELIARIRANIRRYSNKTNPIWQCGNITFDTNKNQFFQSAKLLDLRPKEHAILFELLKSKGAPVSKTTIYDSIYKTNTDASFDAIEIHISRLRKKIQSIQVEITTIRGVGYMIDEIHQYQ